MAYWCPLIEFIHSSLVQLMVCRQQIFVQYDVGCQFIIDILCPKPICVGQLGQISQLVAVGNQVRIFLRTGTACERVSHIAHPYQWKIGIAVEGCRNANAILWHRERPDILANAGQCHRLSRLVVDKFQTAVCQQHALVDVKLHIDGLTCLGITGTALQSAILIFVVEADAATGAIGQSTHRNAKSCRVEGFCLTHARQTLNIWIVALCENKRFT